MELKLSDPVLYNAATPPMSWEIGCGGVVVHD